MSDTIAIVATIVARPGHRSVVAAALKIAAADTLAEPGCEQYALHLDRHDPNCFVMIERWIDQASIDRHAKAPAFTALAAVLKDRATLQVAFYDPIA